MKTAETLIVFTKYDDLDTGTQRQTRTAPGTMVWLVTAVDGKVYQIRFEKNFAKKHLYTSSKKQKQVKEEVVKLWNALSKDEKNAYWWKGYWISYPPELWAEAQKPFDEAKFNKQLGHRSTAEQSCHNCGHKYNKHFNNLGGAIACTQGGGGCGCMAFISGYGKTRQDKGKTTENPLSGATTNRNTAIIMNRIPKALMENTIANAIIAKELAVAGDGRTWGEGHVGHDADCEKVTLDFGVVNKGCIIEVTGGGDFSSWDEKYSVPVSIRKGLPVADANRPVYYIGHMFGNEAV
jgi:hypothetical protein